MKKISIVTISFNQCNFIKDAIHSVLNQDYPHLEYIVIDAGSTDGSREIIDSYGDRIIKIFEPDKGQADGLNKGLALATGEIIGFVNSDDLLLKGALQKVNSFFYGSPDLDILFGSGYKVDQSLNVIHDIYPDRFSPNKYAYMAFNFIQTATFFKRSTVLKFGGFNLANRTCWDGELVAKMGVSNAKFKRTFSKLAAFRIYNDSISGAGLNTEKYLNDRARIFSEITGKDAAVFFQEKNPIALRMLNLFETPLKLKVLFQKHFPKWMTKNIK